MIFTVNNNELSSFIYKNAEPPLEVQRFYVFFTEHY